VRGQLEVRAALAYAARGETPLSIVYATDAKIEPGGPPAQRYKLTRATRRWRSQPAANTVACKEFTIRGWFGQSIVAVWQNEFEFC
jgi:hypothetical protein